MSSPKADDAADPFAEWAPALEILREALRAMPGWEEDSLSIDRGDGLPDMLWWTARKGARTLSHGIGRFDLEHLDMLRTKLFGIADHIVKQVRRD